MDLRYDIKISSLNKQAWNCIFNVTGWTSGSGFSNYSSRPSWQDDVVSEYLNKQIAFPPLSYWNNQGRAYPDVSMVAHNYQVVNSGYVIGVDGTSASTPSRSSPKSIS